MKNEVGLWIDHRKAFVVTLSGKEAKTQLILSDAENLRGSFTGEGKGKSVESRMSGSNDRQDRDYEGHLGIFYKDVINHVKSAESILLMGPGEAKGELKKIMAKSGIKSGVVEVETDDKMTDPQIIAKVREYYSGHAD